MKLLLFILGIVFGLCVAAAIVVVALSYLWAWATFGGNK